MLMGDSNGKLRPRNRQPGRRSNRSVARVVIACAIVPVCFGVRLVGILGLMPMEPVVSSVENLGDVCRNPFGVTAWMTYGPSKRTWNW